MSQQPQHLRRRLASTSTSTSTPTPRRTVSFGGGPGALRESVLAKAGDAAFLRSVLEDSHRAANGTIQRMIVGVQDLFRELLDVPDSHEVMFFQGGAHAQFAAVPLNVGARPRVLGVETGSWSRIALAEQAKFADVSATFSPNLKHIKSQRDLWARIAQEAAAAPRSSEKPIDYVYVCTNETMRGSQITADPPESFFTDLAVVADATSDLLSRRMNLARYGVVFASGGKNIGPAGFAVVIARKDIVHDRAASPHLPGIMSWREMAQPRPFVANIYNTPCMLSIGIAKLVLEDTVARGGIDAMAARSLEASKAVYDVIDASGGFYTNEVPEAFRSRVSVTFRLPSVDLEQEFLDRAANEAGLLQLVNHPSVGGLRASLYNGLPDDGVERLLGFMRAFRKAH